MTFISEVRDDEVVVAKGFFSSSEAECVMAVVAYFQMVELELLRAGMIEFLLPLCQ